MQKQFVTAGGWKFSLINNDEQDANRIKEIIKNVRYYKEIFNYAFSRCSSLTQISIPSSVTSIGQQAFEYCSSLTQIEIPATATTDPDIFFGCNSLRDITILIPNNVTDNNYITCFSLFSKIPHSSNIKLKVNNSQISFNDNKDNPQKILLNLPTENQNVKDFIAWIFQNCTNLTKFTISSNVTSIGKSAFSGCSSLMQIEIPSSVTSIGNKAFLNCSSLMQIEIPSSVTSIDGWTFYGCSNLWQITIPGSVTSIGQYAFSYCSSLTEITIPGSVTSIGQYAFYDCSSLTEITIPGSVTSIGGYAFTGCSSLRQITIPKALSSQTRNWGLDKNVKIVVEDPQADNKNIQQKPELYSKNESGGWKFSVKNNDEQAKNRIIEIIKNFPDPNKIPDRAFGNCESLIKIEIPSNVTSIGNFAFSWCSNLTQIEIPSSVTSIGSSAFLDCSSLMQITIPSSVTSIGDRAFAGCSSLTQIKIPKDKQLISMVFDAITSSNIAPTITFTPNQSKEYNNSDIPPLEERDREPR